MKLDTVQRAFTERYNREALESIDYVSKDLGLRERKQSLPSFNLSESFDQFLEFLSGYVKYQVESAKKDDEEKKKDGKSKEEILEGSIAYIQGKLFTEQKDNKPIVTLYAEFPTFISEYLNGVKRLSEAVEDNTLRLMEAEVAPENIGDINQLVEAFIDKLHLSFYPIMEKMLWASGYKSKEKLCKESTNAPEKKKPVFL